MKTSCTTRAESTDTAMEHGKVAMLLKSLVGVMTMQAIWTTGLSQTHGVQVGVKMDSSEFNSVNAESMISSLLDVSQKSNKLLQLLNHSLLNDRKKEFDRILK